MITMSTTTSMTPISFLPISQLMSRQRSLSHPIAAILSETPHHQHLDWQTFKRDIIQLHQHLQATEQQRWAICCDNSYWFAVAFMAAAHSQKHIIIPGNLQPAALAELSSQFDAILYDEAIDVAFLSGHPQVQLPLSSAQKDQADIQFSPLTNVDITLFTSGSSGQPKAIHKPLAILEKEVAQLEATWGESLRGAITASTVSHQHIYGLLFRILWPLSAGRPFWGHDWQYPEHIIEHANSDTILVSSPALLKRLAPHHTQQAIRAIFSSGGPLDFASAQHCQTLFDYLPHEVLGSTETGGIAHRQQVTSQQPWQAFTGTQIATNPEGCLRILSPLVDEQHWYQTADQCEIVDPQHFVLKGRADRIIKIEEKRISLTEIEKRLHQLAEVAEAAVIPYQDTNRLITAAAITLTPEGVSRLNSLGKGRFHLMLRKQLHQWIEPVGIPRRFRIIEEIPLNTQGKRLVSDIEQLFHSTQAPIHE